jgi:rRNA N6-adenosine-methyltransferase METTL5
MSSLNKLEKILKELSGFSKPKVELEQYATDSHLASRTVFLIQNEFEDIEGNLICDMGCGCGIFSIASFLMGGDIIFSVDIDKDALNNYKENIIRVKDLIDFDDYGFIELIQADALCLEKILRIRFDTVITNPPFGTKSNVGKDIEFVEAGKKISNCVYSLHKSSTRNFLVKKQNGKVLAQMAFAIPKQFSFHKHNNLFVEVDLIRYTNN